MAADALLEAGKTASGVAAPTKFSHCQQARECEILGIAFRAVLVELRQLLQNGAVNKLVAPETALHAKHGRRRRIVVDWHRIALFKRNRRHPSGSLQLARSAAFGEIKIDVGCRRQDGFVPGLRGLDGVLHFMPHHCHHRLAHLAALYDFFPANHGFALGFHHVGNHVGEIALQVGCLGDAFALHHFFAQRALLPTVVNGFVATDVDVVRREKTHRFVEHIGKKLQRRLLAYAQQVTADKMLTRHLVLLAGARQPRICHHRRQHVGRKLNLWDNLHATHCGVCDNLFYVVLRIISAQAVLVLACPSANFGEARIFLDFEAPARIVNQVELQLVHLVHRHHVDVVLHKLLVEEITCHIKHHASPRMVRGIAHQHLRQTPLHIALKLSTMHRWRQ